ncbi:MAG TPA: hypothetical protein DEV93_00595 [Chloroflexi bacterium]|nr:hypothetical protein [Chloroflexota bacterium]
MRTSALSRSRWYLWPLLVPPIYEKQRITGMNLLQSLWDQAAVEIETAERLVIAGYSLPESDILARQLLRRSYAANTALSAIDIINPDAGLGPKIQHVLGAKVIRIYSDVRSFLDHS